MRKIISLLLLVGVLGFAGCAKDILDTDPTDRVSGTAIFTDADNAMTALNGIYRAMYTSGWGSDWTHENGGVPAFILVFDLYGEDHIMDGSGSGWFWYDYGFGTWGDWSHNAGHQYQIWNFFYTVVSNVNYILAEEEELEGDEAAINKVFGQAYALRAWAYSWLVQAYAQSWDNSKPGVPLYTEPTIAGSEGNPRGTVGAVWEMVNSDLDKSIAYFEAGAGVQSHPSHVDKYVAYGLKARAALVQKDYPAAESFGKKALEGSKKVATSPADFRHINDVKKVNVLWGLEVQADQSMGNPGVYAHMDADSKGTYSNARHLISKWLYDRIPTTDSRKAWWTDEMNPNDWGEAGTDQGSKRSWCQTKLVYQDPSDQTGDFILMRAEEMALIVAEAACQQEKWPVAREYLSMVGDARDDDFATRIAARNDSKVYSDNTHALPTTLMEEILLQRRIELWGEVPRAHDLLRLGLGYDRDYAESNHTVKATNVNTGPYSPAFILWIPRTEFDGNDNMDLSSDQNPSQD